MQNPRSIVQIITDTDNMQEFFFGSPKILRIGTSDQIQSNETLEEPLMFWGVLLKDPGTKNMWTFPLNHSN